MVAAPERIEVIAEAVKALRDAEGRVTPERVLEAARDPDSPLHDRFEWDIERAAYAYQLDQARELLRSVEVHLTVTTREVAVIAYVRDPDRPAHEQGYRAVEVMRSEEETGRRVLDRELRQVQAYIERARALAAAFDLTAECDAQLRLLL